MKQGGELYRKVVGLFGMKYSNKNIGARKRFKSLPILAKDKFIHLRKVSTRKALYSSKCTSLENKMLFTNFCWFVI